MVHPYLFLQFFRKILEPMHISVAGADAIAYTWLIIALLIIMEALFGVDAWDDLEQIWKPIRKAIDYISPGPWIIFRRIPRPGYRRHIEKLDRYLYGIISARRASGFQYVPPMTARSACMSRRATSAWTSGRGITTMARLPS